MVSLKEEESALNAHLNQMDVKDLLPTCVKEKTTTVADFVNHMEDGRVHKPSQISTRQLDPALLTGHCANNLKLNNIEERTRTWPYAMDWREDYRQFIERTKLCNEKIYKLFFECPPVRYDQIENYLRDLRKTIYGTDYSPNEYASLYSRKKVQPHATDSINTSKDILTTYGNSYNRLQELAQYGTIYHRPLPKVMTVEKFAENMRKLFRKYDLSTYFETICLPALMSAKDGKMPTGPIDRYTLRKY